MTAEAETLDESDDLELELASLELCWSRFTGLGSSQLVQVFRAIVSRPSAAVWPLTSTTMGLGATRLTLKVGVENIFHYYSNLLPKFSSKHKNKRINERNLLSLKEFKT
jgi:hypothetical protein